MRRCDAMIGLAGLICLAVPGVVLAQQSGGAYCTGVSQTCWYQCSYYNDKFITNPTPLFLGHCYGSNGTCTESGYECTGKIYGTYDDCKSGTNPTVVISSIPGC